MDGLSLPVDNALLELMRGAATEPPRSFVENFVIGGEPYALGRDADRHLAFRTELADKLAVPVDSVILIGSAKTGFSLNRDHLLRQFGRHSDLDLVVVQPDAYDAALVELRGMSKQIALAGQDERRRLRHVREDTFNGYLRPDRLPLSSTLSKHWFPKLAGPFESELARNHAVKAWLFKSREYAVICYSEYHEKIQQDLRRVLQERGDL